MAEEGVGMTAGREEDIKEAGEGGRKHMQSSGRKGRLFFSFEDCGEHGLRESIFLESHSLMHFL